LTVTGCGGDATSPLGTDTNEATCTIDVSKLQDGGVGRNGIPALTNPTFVVRRSDEASYLLPTDWVIGFRYSDETFAIPHNILWWHEIMNLDFPEGNVAVTYCPLTGTAMAFDPAPLGGVELGVFGLLFPNNLVMFDRSGGVESLFPQIVGEGVCGLRKQTTLPRIAVSEMTNGELVDVETGTTWSLGGRAVEGNLGGASLAIHPELMVAFWFAWSSFHPSTEVWTQ
jgi:Protein of unknown function (DUF3179)